MHNHIGKTTKLEMMTIVKINLIVENGNKTVGVLSSGQAYILLVKLRYLADRESFIFTKAR